MLIQSIHFTFAPEDADRVADIFYRDDAALRAHVDSEHYQRLVINGVRPLAKERLGETVFPLE